MDNINVNPSGSTQIATEEINGVHYQKIIPVNETGEGAAEVEMNWLRSPDEVEFYCLLLPSSTAFVGCALIDS